MVTLQCNHATGIEDELDDLVGSARRASQPPADDFGQDIGADEEDDFIDDDEGTQRTAGRRRQGARGRAGGNSDAVRVSTCNGACMSSHLGECTKAG